MKGRGDWEAKLASSVRTPKVTTMRLNPSVTQLFPATCRFRERGAESLTQETRTADLILRARSLQRDEIHGLASSCLHCYFLE